MKVLFLGNNYSNVSLACLERITTDTTLTVLVGILDPKRGGISHALAIGLQRYDISTVIKKVAHVAACVVVDRLRWLGFPVKHIRSLQSLAESCTLEYFFVQDINSTDCRAHIQDFKPQVISVANFGQIMKSDIVNAPPQGCINMHPSLLPKYRGPTPSYWILKNKEKISGVTIHFIVEGIDNGDIILQSEIAIEDGETENSLDEKSTTLGASMLLDALQLIREGNVERRKQNEHEATYYSFPRLQHKEQRAEER